MLNLFIVFLFLLFLYVYLSKDLIYVETKERTEFENSEKNNDGVGMGSISIDTIITRKQPINSPTRSCMNTEPNGTVYMNGDISTFLPSKVPFKYENTPLIEYGVDMFDPYTDEFKSNKYTVNHASQVESDKRNRIVARR